MQDKNAVTPGGLSSGSKPAPLVASQEPSAAAAAAAAVHGSNGRPSSASAAAAQAGRGSSMEDPMKELELDMLIEDDGNIYNIFGEDG
jgi:hypothetical protein